MPTIIGREFAGYKITKLLSNSGANCFIFDAVQLDTGETAILKVCKDPHDTNEHGRLRKENFLLRNLYTQGTSNHFIRPLSDVFDVDGSPGFFMEKAIYDLPAHLASNKLSDEDKENLFWDVCAALEAAHRLGVAHRDLHAANVLIVHDGRKYLAKIGDFGRARDLGLSIGSTPPPIAFGAPIVTPPEIWFRTIPQSPPVEDYKKLDAYALGISITSIFSGSPINYFYKLFPDILGFIQKNGVDYNDLDTLSISERLKIFNLWLRTNPKRLLADLRVNPQDKAREDRLNGLIERLCDPNPATRVITASQYKV